MEIRIYEDRNGQLQTHSILFSLSPISTQTWTNLPGVANITSMLEWMLANCSSHFLHHSAPHLLAEAHALKAPGLLLLPVCLLHHLGSVQLSLTVITIVTASYLLSFSPQLGETLELNH